MNMIDVRVAAIEQVTPLIKHFKFVKEDGAKLPPFSGGSHIVVALDAEGETYRNPYSLMGSPTETDAYHISVSRKENSRGGSAYMHENISVGMSLKITPPVNFFTLAKTAHKHILIAGGIGIAPFISQIEDLNRIGAEYEMHYAFRSYQQAAFVDDLQKSCGNKLHCYSDSEDIPLDLIHYWAASHWVRMSMSVVHRLWLLLYWKRQKNWVGQIAMYITNNLFPRQQASHSKFN